MLRHPVYTTYQAAQELGLSRFVIAHLVKRLGLGEMVGRTYILRKRDILALRRHRDHRSKCPAIAPGRPTEGL